MCATYASELLHLTVDVKAQRGACSSGWSVPLCLANRAPPGGSSRLSTRRDGSRFDVLLSFQQLFHP